MSSSASQATSPNTIGITGFFTDPGFDFVTRSMIGYAAQGVIVHYSREDGATGIVNQWAEWR